MSTRARKSACIDLLAERLQVAQRHLHEHDRLVAAPCPAPADICSSARSSMSSVTVVTGRKLPRSTSTGFVVEQLRRLAAPRPPAVNIAGVGQPLLHELQAHQPVVHAGERRPGELDHVHFHAVPGQVVHQRADERLGPLVSRRRRRGCRFTPRMPSASCCRTFSWSHIRTWMMISDGSAARLGLEPDAQPAVALLLARVAPGGHGVGEHEELRRGPARRVQPLQQQVPLVVEHRLQALAAHVALRRAVDRVAHRPCRRRRSSWPRCRRRRRRGRTSARPPGRRRSRRRSP